MGKCEGDYVGWIHTAFGECVVTTRDMISFAVGMISNIIWIISSVPQMYQNCKTRVVEGQSPYFFSLLFTGNVLSLVGIIVNGGLVTQYITGVIYVVLDGILFLQYVMYTYCCPPKRRKQDELEELSESPNGSSIVPVLSVGVAAAVDFSKPYQKENLIGTIFGWIGAAIYLGSRLPQVVKNFKERKVRDLSPFYVTLAIGGNLTYALSLFIRSVDGMFLWEQAPWIVMAFGPMTCDFIFLFQMCFFGVESTKIEPAEEEEEQQQGGDDNEDRTLDEL